MDKKSESIKLAFLLPTSRTYVSSDGLIRKVVELGPPKTKDLASEIRVMEGRVANLQSIHDRLDAIIAELEEFLNKS